MKHLTKTFFRQQGALLKIIPTSAGLAPMPWESQEPETDTDAPLPAFLAAGEPPPIPRRGEADDAEGE